MLCLCFVMFCYVMLCYVTGCFVSMSVLSYLILILYLYSGTVCSAMTIMLTMLQVCQVLEVQEVQVHGMLALTATLFALPVLIEAQRACGEVRSSKDPIPQSKNICCRRSFLAPSEYFDCFPTDHTEHFGTDLRLQV